MTEWVFVLMLTYPFYGKPVEVPGHYKNFHDCESALTWIKSSTETINDESLNTNKLTGSCIPKRIENQ